MLFCLYLSQCETRQFPLIACARFGTGLFQPAFTCQWHRSGVFIANFEHISHIVLLFPLLNLNE